MKKKPLSWINSYIGIILKEKGFKEVAVTIPDE